MKNRIMATAIFITIMFSTWPIVAQELYVFPGKGQSQEQTEKDKYACYTWARGETGFDPMQPPTASTPPPAQQAPTTSPLRGAARGAAVGAIIEKDGSSSKGAATGAAAGALVGGMRRRNQMAQQQQKEEEWAQNEAANYEAKRAEYNRAYTACLEAKGYSVK